MNADGTEATFDTLFMSGRLEPRDMVNAIEEAGDPRNVLLAIGLLQRWLNGVEDEFVLKARVEGMSWATIGTALGRTKQSVWEKHRDPDEVSAAEV